MALDWDILNEDCADMSDWFNADTGGCTTTQVTFDGQSCFKFDCPATAADGDSAQLIRAVSFPDAGFTYEHKFYLDDANSNYFYVTIRTDPSKHYYRLFMKNTSTPRVLGLRVTDTRTTAYAEVEDLLDGWHTIRLVVKASRLTDVWLDDRLYLARVPVAATSALAVGMNIFTFSDHAADKVVYTDYIKVDTTPEGATAASPLTVHGEKLVVRYRQSGVVPLATTDVLRMQGSGSVLGIPLVATDDTNASTVRIYDGAAVKALMQLPS